MLINKKEFLLLILFTFSYSLNMNIEKIESISLREKKAQMIMIRVDGNYHNKNDWSKKRILEFIKEEKVGGIISFTGNIHGAYYNIKEYQEKSEIPCFSQIST